MDKTEDGGMEKQATARLSVQSVALDGIVKSTLMGAVDTQLVRPACQGGEFYAVAAQRPIACDRLLSFFIVHHLPRTVGGIGT